MITSKYKNTLRGLCKTATPGPWAAEDLELEHWGRVVSHGYSDEEPGICGNYSKEWKLTIEDAKFIASARDAIPTLLDKIEMAEYDTEKAERDFVGAFEQKERANAARDRALAEVGLLQKALVRAEQTVRNIFASGGIEASYEEIATNEINNMQHALEDSPLAVLTADVLKKANVWYDIGDGDGEGMYKAAEDLNNAIITLRRAEEKE